MSFFATPKRLKQSNNLADSECRLRVGQAYNTDFPWDSCTSPELKKWLGLVSGARKCRPEYVLLSLLPSISALSGPDTRLEISEGFHSEKLNLFMCILGESGANKSGAYGLTTGVMKAMADTERLVLDSNWSRSGLLGHLRDTRGTCLLSYEEMDPFFSNVLKMEKQGVSERTFFCELYDGRPQSITRSTNDGKVCRHMIGETTMNIIGYHQPEPFLKDYFELSLRRDGFMERFLICCPQSLRISQPEVETCRADLAQSYNHSMRDLKALYAQIYELFREGGKVYRLSPNASAQYQELAAEENEDYNRNLQQKMAEASQPGAEPVVPGRQLDPQLETKFVRSVLKLSATLHILEGVFSSLTKEDDGSGSPPVIPSDISEGTLKRGRALAQYFAAQRHILFKPVTEDVTDLPRTDTLVRRILLCRGYVANRREIRGSYNLATRPKPEEVDGVFAELETNGCGKVAKEGAYEGFIKNPTLTDQYAAKYNITIEEYDAKLTAVSPWLSKKPKAEETFRKLYLAAYPDTAPSVSIVKSEQKSP